MNKKFNKFSSIDKLSRFRGIFPTRLNKLRFDANERVSEFENKFIQLLKKKIKSHHLLYPGRNLRSSGISTVKKRK